MFEQLEDTVEKDSTDKVTVAEALGVYLLLLFVFAVTICAFIALDKHPYGIQIATLTGYSGAVFVYTFFRTRGVNTKYSLLEPYVQQQLPRLLLIHCIYLLGIFFLETVALSFRPSMSNWWLDSREVPPFDFALMIVGTFIAVSQVILSRRILSRSKEQFCSAEASTTRF